MKKDHTAVRTSLCGGTIGRSLARQTLRAAAVALPLLAMGTASLLAQSATTSEKTSETTAAKEAPAANEADPSRTQGVTRLEPVIIVASRTPELLSGVSPSVSYIGEEQLALAGNYTIADALREQPGLYVLGNAFGNIASVFIRGVESRWTQFTLDGRRLNPGFSGFDSALFTSGNLASVQIARGASSTFHGANAAGGVVDLRTIDPLDFEKPAGNLSGEAGSYGYWRGAFEYGAASDLPGNYGRVGISLGTSWTEADNLRPNSDYRSINFLPRIDWRVNDHVTLNFVARHFDYEAGMPGDIYNPSLTERQSVKNTLVSPGVKIRVNDKLDLQAYYSYTRNEYANTGSAWSDDHNIADGHEGTLQATWKITDTVALSGGYTYESKIYDRQSQRYHRDFDSHSPWLNLRLTPLKDLLVSVAGRYNNFTSYDDATTGEASIRYRIAATNTTLHARVANAYAVPDIGTLSYDTSYGYGPAGHFRTKDLEPEKNLSWEVGVKQQINFLNGASLGAVFFQNHITDLIQWDWTTSTAYNINKAFTQGVELSADLRPLDTLRFYANATFLRAENRTAHNRLQRRPDFTGTLGVEHTPTDAITVGLSVTYVHGVEDVDARTYGRTDNLNYTYGRLYANFRVWKNVEIFGRVENLFDKEYVQVNGYPSLPVNAYVGVRVRF